MEKQEINTTEKTPPTKTNSDGMNVRLNKTTLFIGVLILLTGLLVYLALSPINNKKQDNKNVPTTNVNVLDAKLSMGDVKSLPSNSYSIDVNLDSGSHKVTGVQLEISYNPADIRVLDIAPSSLIKAPTVLLKNVDVNAGRITYAIGVPTNQKGVNGEGSVATITFVRNTAPGRTTSFDFLPKTAIAAEGYAQSVLKQSAGITFTIGTPTPPPIRALNSAPQSSPSPPAPQQN